MLNGVAPIFLFHFFKNVPSVEAALNKVPVVSSLVKRFGLPPIPLYLDEKITGIYVDSENKNIDIETDVEGNKEGKTPEENQRPVNSSVTIEMLASSDSIGLTILSAMMDVILPKITSKEYAISYLHGAVTVFNSKLQSFSINQNSDNTLYRIQMVLSNSSKKTAIETGISTAPVKTGAEIGL